MTAALIAFAVLVADLGIWAACAINTPHSRRTELEETAC